MSKETSGMKQAFKGLFRPRILLSVIRMAGLLPMTVAYVLLFILSSFVLVGVEPSIVRLEDAGWFLFMVITTVGLGDFTCVTYFGRLVTIVLSFCSVFYIALVTGAVVSYCGEVMRARRDESIAAFLDQLEHLPELSHEELVEISERVKRL